MSSVETNDDRRADIRFTLGGRQSGSPGERSQKALAALQIMQEVELSQQWPAEATVRFDHDRPLLIMIGADIHAGGLATDYDELTRFRDFVLDQPDCGVVLLGDEIEGMVGKYLDTIAARTILDVHTQIELIREEFIKPLDEAGKLFGMVAGYWGHPGWVQSATTLDPWRVMMEGVRAPLIRNGGVLRFQFANGDEQSLQIFHNPPGKSQYEATYGLTKVAGRVDEEVRGDGMASAHIHRMGVGNQHFANADKGLYVISSGTLKGSNPDLPSDRFGINLGLSLADPMGQGVVVQPTPEKMSTPTILRKDNKTRHYPIANIDQAAVLHDAIRLWDSAESQQMTDELIGEIYSSRQIKGSPEINFRPRKSEKARDPYDETPENEGEELETGNGNRLAPQYEEVQYDIRSSLPVLIHFIANVRAGSSYEGLGRVRQYFQDFVETNPHALIICLRSMVDREVASSPQRLAVLGNVVELLKSVEGRVLALLLDESLRESSWRRFVGGKQDGSPAVAAASFLSQQTGVPLVHHQSRVQLGIGPGNKYKRKPRYTGVVVDKLNAHGSQSRPTFGQLRVYQNYLHKKPSFVVGGHMQNAGTMVFHDRSNQETHFPALIAPGWWATYVDSMGKGNVNRGAIPGQGMVLMPGRTQEDHMMFPTANADESHYVHQALVLYQGLTMLGIINRVLEK